VDPSTGAEQAKLAGAAGNRGAGFHLLMPPAA